MELSAYMKQTGMTDATLAEKVKRDRSNVTRWRLKQTRPDFDALIALEAATEGNVTARDFMQAEGAV